MRSLVRRALVLGGCIVATVVASGCEGKQATEYVAGISTQVSVPRDLKAVRVQISVGGSMVFCQGYRVFEGKVLLPRSLGAFAQSDAAVKGAPVTFEIVGLKTDNLDTQFFATCGTTPVKVKTEDVRVLRRSRQPYVENEIKFLPMPIKYSCFDKDCPEDQTCKGGKCAPMDVADPASLPNYTPELLDGTGGTCFRVKSLAKDGVTLPGCMEAIVQPVPVDTENCIYAVPGTPSAPAPGLGAPDPFSPIDPALWQGVNVEITYDGGLTKEILDKDPEEGFTVPDPAFPQRFKLAPGLCEMVKGYQPNPNAGQPVQGGQPGEVEPAVIPTEHRITSIRTSGTCQAKLPTNPLCAEDQLALMGANPDGTPADQGAVCQSSELVSPPSALVVVVDNTTTHQRLFDRVNAPFDPNDEDTLIEPAIRGALSDPAFRSTDMGLEFTPGNAACDASGDLDIPLGPTITPGDSAASAAQTFLARIKTQPTVDAAVSLEGALARAYAALRAQDERYYYRRAVLVLGNGEFTADACPAAGGPVELATAEASPSAPGRRPINTYVMQLLKDPGKNGESDALASAGGTVSAAWRTAEATQKFQEIVNTLATCTYDVDAAPAQSEIVAFTSPLTAEVEKLSFNAACSAAGAAGEGWGIQTDTADVPDGKTRIHLCEASCNAYRDVLKSASTFAAIYQQAPLPVPVYKYQPACE